MSPSYLSLDFYPPHSRISFFLHSWLKFTARKQTAIDIYFILFSLACSHTFDGQTVEIIKAKGGNLHLHRPEASAAFFITDVTRFLHHKYSRECKKISNCMVMNICKPSLLPLRGGSGNREVVDAVCNAGNHPTDNDLASRLVDPAGDLSITAGALSTLLPKLETLLR
jgi:hypothetical protein